MRNLWIVLGLAVALAGCTDKNRFDIPTGTDVTVEKTDGVTVAGRLVEVQPEQVVVESRDGVKTRVQVYDRDKPLVGKNADAIAQ